MKKARNLVIGDVHGSAKALKQVLERCNFDPNYDKLISIGDIADGWSEVSECVDILLDIKLKSKFSSVRHDNEPVFIRGNHDVWMYDYVVHGLTPSLWTTQGGKATLDSYIRTQKLILDENHRNFWLDQEDWYIDEKDNLFIHAGWDYGLEKNGWEDLSPRELFERQANDWYGDTVGMGSIARSCHWDRDIWKGSNSGRHNGFNPLKQFNQVFIGHTAISTKDGSLPQPVNNLNLWNVDTGAGWYGCLTILDINTHEYWQSDLSKDLYPNEKGR